MCAKTIQIVANIYHGTHLKLGEKWSPEPKEEKKEKTLKLKKVERKQLKEKLNNNFKSGALRPRS